jgi:hypothetical protein
MKEVKEKIKIETLRVRRCRIKRRRVQRRWKGEKKRSDLPPHIIITVIGIC